MGNRHLLSLAMTVLLHWRCSERIFTILDIVLMVEYLALALHNQLRSRVLQVGKLRQPESISLVACLPKVKTNIYHIIQYHQSLIESSLGRSQAHGLEAHQLSNCKGMHVRPLLIEVHEV